MRKSKKDLNNKEIRFEVINIEEGHTRLGNLVKCYPYNPEKIDFRFIPWIRNRSFDAFVPFCGIIENCHKKGFQLFSDWMETFERQRRFYTRNIINIRNHITEHFIKLIEKIGFKKVKEIIVVNNAYKELDCWFKEMYKNISIMDHRNGWKDAYLEESRKINKIAESYEKYRKNKEKRLRETIKNYEEQKKNLQQKLKNENKFKTWGIIRGRPPMPIGIRLKRRKIPKNMTELERINNKLERYKYNETEIHIIKDMNRKIENKFVNIFKMHVYPEDHFNYFISSKEFDMQINEIFLLLGKDWVSCVNGSLMIIGQSVEDIEEIKVYKDLQKYPRVLKNFEKARKNILDSDWNDVPHYCCKSVERFYNILLGDKKKYENLPISDLTELIRKNEDKIFRISLSGVKDGLDYLILSTKNLIGTLRNKKDSGHGNPIDVEKWEAKMCYSYTLLLLSTLFNFIK